MTKLAILLGGLFVALAVVVKLTERFGQPMEQDKMQKYSSILVVLLVILVLASVLKFFLE